MRVTNSMMFRSATRDLGDIAAENAKLLQQSGTGKKLTRPSDDPGNAVRALRLRSTITGQEHLVESLRSGLQDLKSTELAMDNATEILQRAKELAIEAANGGRSQSDLAAVATEADQLLKDLLAIANRKENDRFIFAGTATNTSPFTTTGDPITAVTYNGNSDARQVEPAPGITMNVSVPGDRAFGTGGSVFQALIGLRDAARNQNVNALSNSVSSGLDSALDTVVNVRTGIGSISAGLERSADNLDLNILDVRGHLGEIEDVDIVDTMVKLQQVENRRTAALQTTARVLQPNLFDYLA